ncbi:SEC-C domain-containing protein [Demequina sp. TTPB684]|uniref:YchJ family protein n=1 Tax=Demequina sp. TMPB413 TaxID=2881056 RepID=UPI001CF45E75|nr:YchJ family metal-binding protein [Demequina sp. TMPB413]MCB2412917.1 SEC-C domain-containing protein [Demequina sp. TTPB684]UPU87858.1 SEC-C domain-containing protein [Demequina sp. TMPB413]
MTGPPCPCGSGATYRECCGPFLRGESAAPTAEALMRSRYTAYVRRDARYLLSTWNPSTRPAALDLDDAVWLELEVKSVSAGGEGDASGTVSFVARYQGADGVVAVIEETSRFVREPVGWQYVDGDLGPAASRQRP